MIQMRGRDRGWMRKTRSMTARAAKRMARKIAMRREVDRERMGVSLLPREKTRTRTTATTSLSPSLGLRPTSRTVSHPLCGISSLKRRSLSPCEHSSKLRLLMPGRR